MMPTEERLYRQQLVELLRAKAEVKKRKKKGERFRVLNATAGGSPPPAPTGDRERGGRHPAALTPSLPSSEMIDTCALIAFPAVDEDVPGDPTGVGLLARTESRVVLPWWLAWAMYQRRRQRSPALDNGLSIFGASMAGACVGFLFHNGYKASVFMGDTGSLALGGALAAMAACTGMFFPLFICSGAFVLEVLSVIVQISYYRTTKRMSGIGRRLFRMAPLHHHLEFCGFREPSIVAGFYILTSILSLIAGYVGLISA